MATTTQITAALANAQLSTGPRSAEGKAASSKNALKLGLYAQTPILPGEDAEELAALARSFTGRFRPQTPIEEAFLEDLVRAEWLKRRYRRIEAEVINARFAALPEDSTVGDVFIQDAEGPGSSRKSSAASRPLNASTIAPSPPSARPSPNVGASSRSRPKPPAPVRKNEPDLIPTCPESTPPSPRLQPARRMGQPRAPPLMPAQP
jgi:hypothetical protein